MASAPRAPGHSPLAEELAAALRAAVESGPGRPLGSGYQASVEVYASAAGNVVVKKPHRGMLGALWRALVRREHAVYARLGGIAGIPRSFGLIDGEYLTLEYVPGPSLRDYEARLANRDAFFAKLLQTLQAMHAAGVAHGDLKRKDNVIVAEGERPYLIDFGIACRRSHRSTLWNRLAFDPMRQMDYNAWVKLKYGRRIDPLDAASVLAPADAALYQPLWIERLARAVRVPWQTLTLRRPRQRGRARRNGK